MSRRTLLLFVLAFACGFAASHFTRPDPRPGGIPETVEVFRPACGDLPAVADTVRVLAFADGGNEHEVEPGETYAGRPEWVVRLRFSGRSLVLRGVALNHPPG